MIKLHATYSKYLLFSDVICGIGAVYLFTIPKVTVCLGNRICQDPLENCLDNSDKEEEPTGIHHHLSSSATLKQCALSLIHVALYMAIVSCTIDGDLVEPGPLPKRPRPSK